VTPGTASSAIVFRRIEVFALLSDHLAKISGNDVNHDLMLKDGRRQKEINAQGSIRRAQFEEIIMQFKKNRPQDS